VLGAMHTVDRALQKIKKNAEILERSVDISDDDIQTARFAALLHDVGHQPFSHALDKIIKEDHQVYSVAITENRFAGILESAGVEVKKVTKMIEGEPPLDKPFLSSLINSQLDVDKLDYLMRDSHYAGVKYGIFDLERILDSLCVIDKELMITDGGYHSAVQLIVARYYMFEQLYLHKTKRAFEWMAKILAKYLIDNGRFPYPQISELKEKEALENFSNFDDAWFLSVIANTGSEEMDKIAQQLLKRTPYKVAIETDDIRKKMMEKKEVFANANVKLMGIAKDIEYNLAQMGLTKNEVIFDEVSSIPYKLRPYTLASSETLGPEIVYIYNERVGAKEPIETRSVLVRTLAEANLSNQRFYVSRSKYPVIQRFLEKNHPDYFRQR
jgi:HD superfamily phosphohydrolase